MTMTEEQLDLCVKNNPHFEDVLINSESPCNTDRTRATDCLNRCKDFKPDDFICQLLRILKDNKSSKQLRQLSAIQLCQIDIVMLRLADSTLKILKTTLVFSLENENVKFISEKVCEAVALIAPALLTQSAWPNLFHTLVEWLISSIWKQRKFLFVRNNLQKLALLIFAQFGHNMREALSPHLTPIFHRGLFDCFKPSQSLEVRFAALSAAINLMPYSEKFEVFVPSIMNTLTETLECDGDAMAEEALKLLIELGIMKPSVFHRQLVDVIELMVKIMEEDGYEEGPRHLAIEFVIQLVEARGLAEGDLPLNSIIRLVSVLLKMFLETDDEDTGDTSTYAFYLEHLNKLLVSLGGDSILPVASGPEFQKSQIVDNMIKRFKKVILIIHGRRLPEATSHPHLSPPCTVIILDRLLMSC